MKNYIRFCIGLMSFGFVIACALAQPASIIPSRFLPGDAAVSGAAADQTVPVIATGGETMLAVWSDKRSYPAVTSLYYEFETAHDIYGMRLDATGNPIDAIPFVITQEAASQDNPQVVWNGTNWLVLFESYDLSGTGFYYQKSLEAVRVSPAGQVLDPAPIKIRGVTPSGLAWAAASDGTDWVLVFQGSDSSSIELLRITGTGAVVQPLKTIVDSTYYSRFNLRLAFAGGVYLFTWTDFYDTFALRFDTNLNVLDMTPETLVTGYSLSDLESNGTQFFITWVDQLPPQYILKVKGARINTDGVVLDPAGLAISGNNQPTAYTTTGVVWDGTYWRVTWGFQNAVSVARITTGGVVLDPGGVSVAGPMTGPTTSLPGGGVELVWSVYSNNQYDVFSAAIPPTNTASATQILSTSAPMQIFSDTAIGKKGAMMIWRSDTSTLNRIMIQPLDVNGNPRNTPIALESGNATSGPGAPAIAWNGSLYLATWGNGTGIVGQRLRQDGTRVDVAPFLIMPGFGPVDVAALGDVFLVAGRQCGFNCEIVTTFAARVQGTDGTVLDSPPLTIGGNFTSSLGVVAFGGRWLVAYQNNATHDNPIATTQAAFVNADGTHLPEFTAYGTYSTAGGNSLFKVAVAAGPTTAIVVQSAELSSGVETDLVARLINADGSLGVSFNMTPWIGNQYNPSATWDGNQFVVAYMDQKNRFAPWTLDQLDARGDIFAMRINASGKIRDPQGFAFSISQASEAQPSVAGSRGVDWITGSILRNQDPFATYRLGYDLFGLGGNQWPVAMASASSNGGDIPLTVNFSSTGSADPNGSITGYLWDFGDGSTVLDANPAHTFTTPGNYVVTVTVTDNQGAKSANTVPVAVTAPNIPPVAVATANPPEGAAPLDVVFVADGSYDPDGAIGNYLWTFSDGSTYYGSTAYFTFPTPGTYKTKLEVFDARGGVGRTTVTVIARNPNDVAPLPPSNLSVSSVFATQADLHWTDNSSNETSFIPERCVGTAAFCNANPSFFFELPATNQNETSVIDIGLSEGTTYAWRVKAHNDIGDSDYSNTVEATTPFLPPPPTNLTATPNATRLQVDLAWQDNATTETGYTVQRCTGSGCTDFNSIAFLPPDYEKHKDQGVQHGKFYRYRVYAESNAGPSDFSNVAEVLVP